MYKIYLYLILFLFSSYSNAQNIYKIDSLTWHQYLRAGFEGSSDARTNQHKKISSKNGACKIAFMNIQHRMHGKSINPQDVKTQKIAMDMSQMENAFHDSTQKTAYILIEPQLNNDSISLKDYLNTNDKSSIDIGIINYIKESIINDSITNGYFAFAFSIAAGYHLFHLFVEVKDAKFYWFLFDDFGINGQLIDDVDMNKYPIHTMTEEDVNSYLWKYFNHAAYIYATSENFKNSTTIEGKKWPPNDRPMWAKLYSIKE